MKARSMVGLCTLIACGGAPTPPTASEPPRVEASDTGTPAPSPEATRYEQDHVLAVFPNGKLGGYDLVSIAPDGSTWTVTPLALPAQGHGVEPLVYVAGDSVWRGDTLVDGPSGRQARRPGCEALTHPLPASVEARSKGHTVLGASPNGRLWLASGGDRSKAILLDAQDEAAPPIQPIRFLDPTVVSMQRGCAADSSAQGPSR